MKNKFHVIYGINRKCANIINLDTGEIINVVICCKRHEGIFYGVISSTISKYSSFMIELGSYCSASIDINIIDNNYPSIEFVCCSHSIVNRIEVSRDYANTNDYTNSTDYTYSKMISEFCNNSRIRNPDEPRLGLIDDSNISDNVSDTSNIIPTEIQKSIVEFLNIATEMDNPPSATLTNCDDEDFDSYDGFDEEDSRD